MLTINLNIPGQFCSGLGDSITWAWLAHGANVPIQFFATGGVRDMLRIFKCSVVDPEAGDKMPDNAVDPSHAYIRELGDKGRQPRLHYMCRQLGLPTKWQRPPFDDLQVDKFPKRVCLCPNTHFETRMWPVAYWLDLNWRLLDAGYEVIWQLGYDDQRFEQRGPTFAWWGGTLWEAARRLGSCGLVVGNDSMCAHFAGTLGTKTLAVMGPTRPTVFQHIPEVDCLTASDISCTGCHFGTPFRASCDRMCESLARLSPSSVFEYIQKINPLQDESLVSTKSTLYSGVKAARLVNSGTQDNAHCGLEEAGITG